MNLPGSRKLLNPSLPTVTVYDPLQLAGEVEKVVVDGEKRRYYRLPRPGDWYGGIATGDCCGCCLKCVFCWSGAPRDQPSLGRFYSPQEVFRELQACAKRFQYNKLRVSGNEPTIGRKHLLRLLELVEGSPYTFILETNGMLLDRSYARDLSGFKNLHVRVSLKGTGPQEFSRLTGARPEAFELALQALKNLLDQGVACHAAVMLSFSPREGLVALKKRLEEVDPSLPRSLEEEYVFLYPHVEERLKKAGIRPLLSYSPGKIPKKLR